MKRDKAITGLILFGFVFGIGIGTMNVTKANAYDKIYNKPYMATKTLQKTKYPFYKTPYAQGVKKSHSAKGLYGDKLKISRVANTASGISYKTKYGWMRQTAFDEWLLYQGKLNYDMKVQTAHMPVYNKPYGLSNYKQVGSTSTLKLAGHWYHVDARAETNTDTGYYRINAGTKSYWLRGKYMAFNTHKLKGNIATIEKAITTGSKYVGKSKYLWGGGRTAYNIARKRFDCSSFVHYIYARAGVRLGPTATCTTNSLIHVGRKVKASGMKRGDIFFFTDKDEGVNCHVAIYLGNKLFLHDSPNADTRGVGVSSLNDPHWTVRFNGHVRRIIG